MRRRSALALIAGGGLMLARPGMALETGGPSVFRWRESAPEFGGLSALHLFPDGLSVLAVGDRGILVEALLQRDAEGAISGARVRAIHRLRGSDGAVLPDALADSEGIAVAPDGRIFVSFEGRGGGRVRAYARPGAAAKDLPVHHGFRRMGGNSSLEALAIDATGALYTLPEDWPGAFFPLYRFDGNAWTVAGQIPRLGDMLPVGADFGPDGMFYLLERSWRLPLRFGSRVRRFRPGDWATGETLIQTRYGLHDNLEGISVTRDPSGRLRLTMVSDDNFLFFQRTELVEYLMPG